MSPIKHAGGLVSPYGRPVEGITHHNLEDQNKHDRIDKEANDPAHPIV